MQLSRTEKFGFKVLLVLLLFLVIMTNVDALGVTPARKIVDVEDYGLDFSSQFTVVNEKSTAMKVSIDIDGTLSEYVTLDKVLLEFKEGEKEKVVNYNIKLPSDVGEPGSNDINFIVTELPVGEDKGIFVGARISLITSLRVRVPYPGEFIESEVDISSGDSEGNIMFTIYAHNLGSQNIDNARATVEVLGPTNEVVQIFETSSENIETGKRKELIAIWNAKVNPGKYYANIVVVYDGKKVELGKEFNVGEAKLEVRDIIVDDFKLGDIAKFEIMLRNLWNEALDDVYAEMQIYDLDGNLIGTFKTPLENLDAREDGTLLGYWDTGGVDVGEYKAKLVVYYPGGSFERDVETVISPKGIRATVRSTGRAIALSGVSYKFNSVFMIGLFILILINIFWFVYFGKRKNKAKGL